MIDIVVVKLFSNNSIYYVSSDNENYNINELVVIDTENGLQVGKVIKSNYKEESKNLDLPLKTVIKKCSKDDIIQNNENENMSKIAFNDAKMFSKELNLDINFVDCYYNFDRSQLIFNFVSDTRIDFRELAKKLAQKFKTRIELRQIGVRDKAKKIGGLGPCGLFLCCNSFLTDFNSVSINMAKNQYLALNPSKINGVCGRLLCCLDYENDVYSELKKEFPKIGMIADTPLGLGKVISVDIFNRKYKVDLKEKGIVEFTKE